MKEIIPGARYRHYKGGEYTIVGLAHMEARPEEVCVVYRMEYDTPDFKIGTLWVRPIEEFVESVIIDGVTRERFALVTEYE